MTSTVVQDMVAEPAEAGFLLPKNEHQETPNTVHGRLLEAVHIAGYTWKRACDELEWMLEDDRWQRVGGGFDDIDAFLATIDLSEFKIAVEQRKGLARKLKELRAANTSTARALGVGEATIRRDVADSSSDEPGPVDALQGTNGHNPDSPDDEPAWFQEDIDPARLVKNRAARIQREHKASEQHVAEGVYTIGQLRLRTGDLRDTLEDLCGQVDAIVTDPPYPAEFIDEFDALGELAARLLKPHGVLVAMVGQTYLPDYITRLTRHVKYRWCAAYLTDGPATRIHGRKVGTKWKPVLIFGGDEFLTQDVFESRGDDKRFHHWGQSESGMADIVERLTKPGQLVVDPFLGGGTTAVVCRDLGRRFIGCDIDPAAVNVARGRLGSTSGSA